MGPQSAWANAALLKAAWRGFTAQGFWLKPNETASGYTGTRLEGLDVEWLSARPLRLAAMFAYLPHSDIVTRDGLNLYSVRARWHPLVSAPNVNAFVGYAVPGAGYRQLYESQGGRAQAWWVVGMQLNFSY